MDSALPAAAAVASEAAAVVVTVAAVASVVATVMVVAAAVVAAASVAAAAEAVEAVIKPTFPADPEIGSAPSLTAETLILHGETNVTNVKPPNPKVLEAIVEAEGVADSVVAAAEVAVEAVASVVATVMEVAVAEDSAAVTVEAAVEVDSEAAVVVAVAVPCVEAVEADTETVPTKHPTTSMLQENSTKQYSRSHAPPHHKNFYKVATPPQTIFKKKPSPTFSICPVFFLPL